MARVGVVLLGVVLLGCNSAEEGSDLGDLHRVCPEELECRLYGECEQGAAEVMACRAEECGPGEVGPDCLTRECGPQLIQCFFGGHSGSLHCAGIWRCYGDCGDDEGCLSDCRTQADETARALFVVAEICTDHHVFTQCQSPDPACDRAAAVACGSALIACVDHHELQPSADLSAHCHSHRDPLACERQGLRILAACPSSDAGKWADYVACNAAAAGCSPPELSEICAELEALPDFVLR